MSVLLTLSKILQIPGLELVGHSLDEVSNRKGEISTKISRLVLWNLRGDANAEKIYPANQLTDVTSNEGYWRT